MRKRLRKKKVKKIWDFWSMARLEMIVLAPKAPYFLTTDQIKGHESMGRNDGQSQ